MAVMFCALIVASAGLGIAVASRRDPALVWQLAGTLAALPLAGYVLSRSVALPQLEDHVGDWLNPAGVASLVFEAVLIALSLVHLSRTPEPRRSGRRVGGVMRSR